MIRTQVYLPKEQIDELKLMAWSRKTTVSDVLRNLIEEKVATPVHSVKAKNKAPKNRNNWLLSLSKEAEKRGFKGPSDLSTNMDKYLYG